ncbi:MAG TPA: pirin family protein [Streptosporangiaceae bacterium]
MSTIEANPEVDNGPVPRKNDHEVTAARNAQVGDLAVRRLLPLRTRRSVGPWCFIDHYGPKDIDGRAGMNVPPHPHIGLQTVTWLLQGNVLHRDSLGSEQLIRPGQLNLMTSGRGIAHAEESVTQGRDHDTVLHGVQLWVALPDASRHVAPGFEHHSSLPQTPLPQTPLPQTAPPQTALSQTGLARTAPAQTAAAQTAGGQFAVTVFIGEFAGERSPATAFSPIVGAELTAPDRHAAGALPLSPDFEHVIFVATGQAEADGVPLVPGQLLYLPTGLETVPIAARSGTTLFLLGGRPLGERLLMWWNFVARTPEEIALARADWATGEFGAVGGYQGEPLPAPPLDVARLVRPH